MMDLDAENIDTYKSGLLMIEYLLNILHQGHLLESKSNKYLGNLPIIYAHWLVYFTNHTLK